MKKPLFSELYKGLYHDPHGELVEVESTVAARVEHLEDSVHDLLIQSDAELDESEAELVRSHERRIADFAATDKIDEFVGGRAFLLDSPANELNDGVLISFHMRSNSVRCSSKPSTSLCDRRAFVGLVVPLLIPLLGLIFFNHVSDFFFNCPGFQALPFQLIVDKFFSLCSISPRIQWRESLW